MTPPVTATAGAWERLAAAVAARVPVAEIDAIWVFPPIRRDRREFGTAIVATVVGDRRHIHTAKYVATIKGPERGKHFDTVVEEVGSGPLEALGELLEGVRRRLDDDEPPQAIPVEQWYPAPAPAGDDATSRA